MLLAVLDMFYLICPLFSKEISQKCQNIDDPKATAVYTPEHGWLGENIGRGEGGGGGISKWDGFSGCM